MHLQLIFRLTSSIFFLTVNLAVASTSSGPPSVKIEKAIHFLSPGGDVVLVEPGTYEMEATEKWLRLLSKGDERHQALLLAAQAVTHAESLEVPLALSLDGEQDVHMLALFLSDGSGLWVTGSYSGIRTRSAKTALQAKRRFLKMKIDALRQRNKSLKRPRKQQGRTKLNNAMKEIEAIQEQVRNKRQMASTAFQNFDQKANQQYNLLSSVMKAMNEMRKGTVRNMM